MDGVHDMGGMHGFGALAATETEDMHFHAPWHGRLFAMTRALRAVLPYGGDHTRQAIERTEPGWYLAQGHTSDGYYAKWFAGHVAMLRQLGVVTDAELSGAPPASLPAALAHAKAMLAAEALPFLMRGGSGRKPDSAPPRFAVGDAVRTLAHGVSGHTRLPRYARGKTGRIEALRGSFPLADAVAAGAPRSEPVYTVSFAARDLWGGEAAPGDQVMLDLWESYLELPS